MRPLSDFAKKKAVEEKKIKGKKVWAKSNAKKLIWMSKSFLQAVAKSKPAKRDENKWKMLLHLLRLLIPLLLLLLINLHLGERTGRRKVRKLMIMPHSLAHVWGVFVCVCVWGNLGIMQSKFFTSRAYCLAPQKKRKEKSNVPICLMCLWLTCEKIPNNSEEISNTEFMFHSQRSKGIRQSRRSTKN